MAGKIRVFYVEDYKIMRDGMRFILRDDKEIQLSGDAENAEELFDLLPGKKIDVLLLDIYLDGMSYSKAADGFDIIQRLLRTYPEISIIAHSIYDNGDTAAKIMNAGASGFVSKKTGYDELLRAIKTVHSGKKYVCTEAAPKLKNLNKFLSGREKILQSKETLFSKREREVLELVAMGFSSKQIAAKLFITEKTVESHRKNMVEKAKVKNTMQLISYAAATGFV